jgi:tetratricopeptide (TPR) repeat protein
LYNQRASNANLQNLANEAYIEELRAKAAAGEIPKEYAERESARSSKKEEVRPVRLGDDANGWWQFVHLGERIPGGNLQPLPWPVKFLALPQDNTLSLEARSTAELEFGLGPDAAPQIPLGEHQIVAVLEVPDRASLPADHWRGRAESTPAKFNIVPKPARLSLEEEEKMSLQLGRYFNAAGEPAKATEYARKALAANAKSIPALILLGNAQENQGDYRGALETYGAAQRELYREYPRAIEPPLYLAYRISGLIDKLEARP